MSGEAASLPAIRLLAGKSPVVIGHRGYCDLAPENTLPSFELAMDAGAPVVELDYRHSKDGVPVVIHDATLDRTTNAREKWKARRIRVSDRTSREIRTLDAGSWHDQAFAGARVPLLTEALDLILERGRLPLIERKAGDAETLVRLLRDCGFINRVVVISFDWLFLRRVHDLEPGQILGGLGPPTRVPGVRKPLTVSSRLGLPWLGVLAKTGCSIAVWNRPLSWTAVADAHRLGFKVWVYTVNKLRTSSRLLKAGVDGLITDDLAEIQNAVGAPDESG